MTEGIITIDLSHKSTKIDAYSGWSSERRFLPYLTILNQDGIEIIFSGYDTVWQLLDTICYKIPLGRNNFNPVLKHRVQHTDLTSLEILRGIFSESDLPKITIQGMHTEENVFVADHTYSHYDEDLQPSLFYIASILEDKKSETIVFGNYNFIARNRDSENKRTIMTLPSIIALIEGNTGSLAVIRVVQMPNGKMGILSNCVLKNKKYACSPPKIFGKDETEKICKHLDSILSNRNKISYVVGEKYTLPEWKQEISAGSTVAHHKYNYSLLEAELSLILQKNNL
tara:strand:+ start:891 stop:1742 length:852 start_codon:yes stop_codon:yes gene_type:complete